jgi:hypothetical protein
MRKDGGQAAFLISVLAADRPDDLLETSQDALWRGPRLPDSARLLVTGSFRSGKG